MRIMIRRNYTRLQVVTVYCKSALRIVRTETETTTPLYGRVNNFQIRDLLSTYAENLGERLCDNLKSGTLELASLSIHTIIVIVNSIPYENN